MMLILTRNNHESLMIGNDVKIAIMDSKDGKTKFGIEAPNDIPVYRQEIYERIQNECEPTE